MRRSTLLVLLGLIPLVFVVGWLAGRGRGTDAPGAGARKILYYVDPMNPAFRSPTPGTAACGMPLEPVYADGPEPGAGGALLPGAVSVRADRLQLVGVVREPVRSRTLKHPLRLVGTVAADETRLYRISAATAGRVREISTVTTGSHVDKGEILGAYYATDILVPQQNYLRMSEVYQKVQETGSNPRDNFQGGGQLATYWRNVDVARQALMNLGMTAEQLDEVTASHQPAYLVQMRAPAAGIVTARNVALGQSFEAGTELYAIADLSRVWVFADAFEGQEKFFRPGQTAAVTLPSSGRRFDAVVSKVLPRFEAATRTLKVRLEVPNPDLALRPDMFVDVELPVEAGPGIFLPQEAVLDSGTRQAVFVEQAAGVFVSRTVATGSRFGGQVEILGGLMEGETVVTAGSFLLDSESRMRVAGPPAAGAALDPVCGMEVDQAAARARGLVNGSGEKAQFFCSPECKEKFERLWAGPKPPASPAQVASAAGGKTAPQKFTAVDPVCGMSVDPDAAGRTGLMSPYQGAPFYFCSPECKHEFDRNPAAILSARSQDRAMPHRAGMAQPAAEAARQPGQ